MRGRGRTLFPATVIAVALAGPLSDGLARDDGATIPDIIGATRVIHAAEGQTLLDIARENGLGYVELIAANPGVDPWLPGLLREITLPTAHIIPDAPRRGIVINLADQRLYYFPHGAAGVVSYPVGIGRQEAQTRLGETRVIRKRTKPTWIPPPSIRAKRPDLPPAVPPGPDNPLGDYALDLDWAGYVIHGTNNAYGIGRRVSHGCIRLYPEDIAGLFATAPVGTPVTILDDPVKLGWRSGQLFLEVHPTQAQADELEEVGIHTREDIPDLHARIRAAAGAAHQRVDWKRVHQASLDRRGLPLQITR